MSHVLLTFNTGFGSESYRVTGDEEVVRYQVWRPSGWVTKASESREKFDELAAKYDMYSNCNDNPAPIARRIEALNYWK